MQLKNVVIHHPVQGYTLANLTLKDGLIQKVDLCGAEFSKAQFYVTPGFVNSHLHPNQLLDRRLMDELTITELLHQMHAPYKKTDQDRYVQALFVLMEAIKTGATAIYAVASSPLPVIQAFKAFGLQGAVTCFYNDQWEGYGDAPAFTKAIDEKFSQVYKEKTERIDIHIGSASIESASNNLLMALHNLAKKYQTKVNIHVSEGMASVESCLRSRQKTPIRLLDHLGILSENWNLIHAVNIDEEEIALIAKAKAKIIHCPVSNAKTGVGIAPIRALEAAQVTIGLGSDACSNNNTNNILNEAYFASLIHNALHQDPRAVTMEKLKRWLTTNGYQILGKTQKGVIEEGEPADLLLWALKEPAFVPVTYGNFDSTLINNAPDIKPHTVLIRGVVAVENYQFKLMSEETLCAQANEVSAKVIASLSKESCTASK
jgi:5-methylthioadenosine/S-adenosylhomocysteine deaminase